MKRILLIMAFFFTLHLHAQDVWKEGTQWVVTFDEDDVETFFLEGHTTIEGVEYLNLKTNRLSSNIAYIRTEQGDTVVYARTFLSGSITDEFILYDFGTFEPDTPLQYSEIDTCTYEIMLCTDIIDADSLCFYHDVIADGDILPCYHDILFKVGHLGGPLYLFNDIEDASPWGGNKPKRKNISHTVLKLTGNRTVELMPSDIKPVSTGSRTHICYNLQGIRVISPRKGVYIQDGKKWVVK